MPFDAFPVNVSQQERHQHVPRKPLDPSHRKNRERSRRDLWKHHLSHNVLPSKVEASVVHTSRLKSSCLRCAPAVEDTVSCNGRQRRGTKLMEKVVRSKVVFTTITKRHHMGSVKRKRKKSMQQQGQTLLWWDFQLRKQKTSTNATAAAGTTSRTFEEFESCYRTTT